MILWDLPAPWVLGFLFILGAVIGSFLNVCAYRLPLQEKILPAWRGVVDPPSSCPYCQTRIRSYDNVPILGWIWLGGRCRTCRHRISARYPIIEFLNGLLFAGLYWVMVPMGYSALIEQSSLYTELSPYATQGLDPFTISNRLHWQYVYYLIFAEALLVASLIDLDLQIIPDSVTVPAMVVGLLGSLTGWFYLVPVWFQNPGMVSLLWGLLTSPDSPVPWWANVAVPAWCARYPVLHGFAVSAAGFVIGGGSIWFVRIAGAWVFRREAMGFGDVILMAMIGSFLGWQATLVAFFLGCVCALITVAATFCFSRQREIPFGPYLSMGALLVMVAWQPLFAGFEKFFAMGPFLLLLALGLGVTLLALLWLVQGLKWLLGIPLYDEEPVGEWNSADQLCFFASHQHLTNNWEAKTTPNWPGTAAGQGRSGVQRWQGR